MSKSTKTARVIVCVGAALLLAVTAIAAVVDYKGRSVIDSPTGAGGVIIKDNTILDADRVGTYVVKNGIPDENDDADNTNGNGTAYLHSIWQDSNTNRYYRCVDPTATAAVWREAVTGSPQVEIVPPGSTIQAIIDDVTDATADKPYVVMVPPGVYTEAITMKDYVSLKGFGPDVSTITVVGDVGNDFTLIKFADQVTISDLSLITNGYVISDNNSAGLANNTFTVRDCRLEGDWDLFYGTQNGVTGRFDDCVCVGLFDGFIQGGENSTIYLYDCHVTMNNSAQNIWGVFSNAHATAETYVHNCRVEGTITAGNKFFHIITAVGKLRCYNVSVELAVNSSGDIQAVRAVGGDADIALFGGHVTVTNAGAGDAYDLYQTAGTLAVYGTGYSASTGTITGFGADDGVLAADVLGLLEKSADPAEPAEGRAVIWMSDGTGKGDDGDVLIGAQAGGVTKWTTLFDHSAGGAW